MNEFYKEALLQAHIDLAEAECKYEANVTRYNECLEESKRLARIVIALAQLLGVEPPSQATEIFNVGAMKLRKKPNKKDGRTVSARRAKAEEASTEQSVSDRRER